MQRMTLQEYSICNGRHYNNTQYVKEDITIIFNMYRTTLQ